MLENQASSIIDFMIKEQSCSFIAFKLHQKLSSKKMKDRKYLNSGQTKCDFILKSTYLEWGKLPPAHCMKKGTVCKTQSGNWELIPSLADADGLKVPEKEGMQTRKERESLKYYFGRKAYCEVLKKLRKTEF